MAHGHRRAQRRTSLLTGSACLAALALAGCGGGGGSTRPQPAPPPPSVAPTPTPTPVPTPTPTPGAADAEYLRSDGAEQAQAITAYQAGATGRGVKLAIVDGGLDPTNPEFAGRIDPASGDVVSNRGVSDSEGHGTAVTSVAAAARDGVLMHGVAYDATILSFRTDEVGSCDGDGECQHDDRDIAAAVDLARQNGARVINMSLGGGVPSSPLLSAVGRATQAGIIVVISAGNDGREPEGGNPDAFALDNARVSGNGLLIIAGAHDATKTLADFSNRAGSGAQYYLTALGVGIVAPGLNGQTFRWNGTSFSAPVITGAVALLAQAFPTLTSAQIVSLLFDSADDAGASGLDDVYGHGILNIARAFQPRGATSLAGSGAAVSLTDNGQTSPAMGDGGAKGPNMAGVVILDGYSRAFAVDLARTLSKAPQERPLSNALQADISSAAALAGTTAVSITMRRNLSGNPEVGLAQAGLSFQDSRKARAIAGYALSRVTPRTAVALGFSESGRMLQQRLAGAEQNAFLVARDPMTRTGFASAGGAALGIRQDLGPLALTVTTERGKVADPRIGRSLDEPGYSIASITADRRIGPASLALGVSRLAEDGTVLGGRFSSALGSGGATSWFVDGTAGFDLGRGWGAAASYRRGWTSLPGGGLAEGGGLATDAFSFDLSKRALFSAGDRLALRVTQPLRVRSGGFDLSVPVSYDYFTQGVGYEARQYSLAPSGREIDFEAAYGIGMLGGDLSANLFLRTQPGHIETADNDLGGAVRFTLGF